MRCRIRTTDSVTRCSPARPRRRQHGFAAPGTRPRLVARLELRHRRDQQVERRFGFALFHQAPQSLDGARHSGAVIGLLARHPDAAMRRRTHPQALGGEFLAALLAGPEAHDLDRHAREARFGLDRQQALGEIADGDRLAHVEPVGLGTPGQQVGLHHQRHGLAGRHHVAGGRRIGQRQRQALADAVAEDRQQAAAAAEDVAEAHDDRPPRRPTRRPA